MQQTDTIFLKVPSMKRKNKFLNTDYLFLAFMYATKTGNNVLLTMKVMLKHQLRNVEIFNI